MTLELYMWRCPRLLVEPSQWLADYEVFVKRREEEAAVRLVMRALERAAGDAKSRSSRVSVRPHLRSKPTASRRNRKKR